MMKNKGCLALTLLALSTTCFATALPYDYNKSCVETVYSGTTLEGQFVNLCWLGERTFRFAQYEKASDRPIVMMDVPASQVTQYTSMTMDKVTKAIFVKSDFLVLRLGYSRDSKDEETAQVSRFADGVLTKIDKLNAKDLKLVSVNNLAEKGVTEVDEDIK